MHESTTHERFLIFFCIWWWGYRRKQAYSCRMCNSWVCTHI